MSNSDEEKVSPVIEGIIDKVHGERKKDKKIWQREVEHRRNNFVGYDNRDILPDQSGAELSKRKKAKRLAFAVSILVLCCLFSFIYLRPDLFSFLTGSKIYHTVSTFLSDKEKDPVKSAPVEKNNNLPTQPREYSFSQEQISKAKKDLLESRRAKSNLIGQETEKTQSSVDSSKDSEHRYEILLVSGRYVYADSVIVTKDTVTFENKKGLTVSVNRDEITSLKQVKPL